MSGKRVEQIDIIKGICMFVVVLGHSLPDSTQIIKGSAVFYLAKAIHSSILPLFFLISGFVATKCLDEVSIDDKISSIKKRSLRMLVPYFVWGALFIPLRIIFAGYTRFTYDFSEIYSLFLGNNPCGQLWFLYVLFLFSTIAVLFATRKNIKFFVPISLMVALVSYFVPLKYNGISWSNSLFLFFFYFLGLFLSTYKEKIFSCMKLWMFIVSLAIFVFMLWVISWVFYDGYGYSLCRIVISFAGIYMAFYIADALYRCFNEAKLVSFIKEIGRYSMDIYILHSPIGVVLRILLISILGLGRAWFSLVYVILGVFGSYLISRFIIRKIPVLKLLLLGMSTEKKASVSEK